MCWQGQEDLGNGECVKDDMNLLGFRDVPDIRYYPESGGI